MCACVWSRLYIYVTLLPAITWTAGPAQRRGSAPGAGLPLKCLVLGIAQHAQEAKITQREALGRKVLTGGHYQPGSWVQALGLEDTPPTLLLALL